MPAAPSLNNERNHTMQNIYLYKPVVLAASLEDMNPKHKEIALELLHHRKFLTFCETGVQFLTAKEAVKTDLIYHDGSEAVCIYRQILGLPDRSIRTIKAHEIFEQTEDYETLEDLVTLLGWVDHRNESLKKLAGLNAPELILWNAYTHLQDAVEKLQNNAETEDPFTRCCPEIDIEKETCDCHPEARKSLVDIQYYLQIIPGMPEPAEYDKDEQETDE